MAVRPPRASVTSSASTAFSGYAVEFSPFFGDRLACATAQHFGIVGNGCQYLFRVDPAGQLRVERELMTQDGLYDCAWCEHNENILVSACGDGSVKVWDTSEGGGDRPISTLRGHSKEVHSVHWNLVSKDVFASASWDHSVKVWTLAEPSAVRTLQEHTHPVYDVKWSAHSHTQLISCSGDQTLKVWDTKARYSALTLRAHEGDVLSCDWNKYDANSVCTGAVDGLVKLWDLRQIDRPVEAFRGHELAVRRVKWSPHVPTVLASCSYDMSAVVWDASPLLEDPCVARLDHHTEFVVGVDFNLFAPHQLALCSWDNTVELVALAPPHPAPF
eukprot:TRINITY_DN2337_c0_g1_i1.p1 TRINITY_DN2337_c0_g1~~TRINITY_DN2337_c0_g1_i1.p1  ORF type:complete len:358 (+),score=81.45 TRINITY_DN2337_c0_g1_i1:85-1074(+)